MRNEMLEAEKKDSNGEDKEQTPISLHSLPPRTWIERSNFTMTETPHKRPSGAETGINQRPEREGSGEGGSGRGRRASQTPPTRARYHEGPRSPEAGPRAPQSRGCTISKICKSWVLLSEFTEQCRTKTIFMDTQKYLTREFIMALRRTR